MSDIPPLEDGDSKYLFRTYEFSLPESSENEVPTPEMNRISLELRDQYLRALARSKQIREEEAKRKSDASDSAPTNGS